MSFTEKSVATTTSAGTPTQTEQRIAELEKQLADMREELADWRTLRAYGGTAEIVRDFIRGQQSRIHAAQEVERKRDECLEKLKIIAFSDYVDAYWTIEHFQEIARDVVAKMEGGDQ